MNVDSLLGVQWVGKRNWGVDPAQAKFLKRQLAQEGRADTERMNRCTHIVFEPRSGQFHRPGSAADRGGPFNDLYGFACSGEHDRCGETVGPGPDNDGVIFGHGFILDAMRSSRRHSQADPVTVGQRGR